MTVLAGSVPLDTVLSRLADQRPVFHSEADFQHAFAWVAHTIDPQLQVRLETHPQPDVRLDLLLGRPDLDRHTAVELKYLTALWTGEVAGEHFALKNHGARDIRSYDVVKDIARVERFVAARPNCDGLVIIISNDSGYWRSVTHERDTNASAFRLYQEVELAGTRAWGPHTGAGTRRGREADIGLSGAYNLSWRDYSRLPGARGVFRALVVMVEDA